VLLSPTAGYLFKNLENKMTIKGKKAKTEAMTKSISPDASIKRYISSEVKFDTLICNVYNGGYLCFPYNGKHWTEDKIWFQSKENVLMFAKLFDKMDVRFEE
jgi:hypothetical protein